MNAITLSIQIPEKIHGSAELTTPNSREDNSVFTRNETCRPKSYLDCQPSISSLDVTGHFAFSKNTLFILFFYYIFVVNSAVNVILGRNCIPVYTYLFNFIFKAILSVIWGHEGVVPFIQLA